MYYVLVGRLYVRILGDGAWSLTKYRTNATSILSRHRADMYVEVLTKKGHEAYVRGPWKPKGP